MYALSEHLSLPLIGYTRDMCHLHSVEMHEQWSGPIGEPDALDWAEQQVLLPRGPEGKLLLVPKSIVRSRLITNLYKYYRDFLRPILRGGRAEGEYWPSPYPQRQEEEDFYVDINKVRQNQASRGT